MATVTRPLPATTGTATTAAVMHTPPVTRSKPIMLIVILFLSFVLLSGVTIAWINNNKEPKKSADRKHSKGTEKSVPYSHTKGVDFTDSYSNVTYLPSGFDFALVESTVPYCVKNKNGDEYCGKKGQDISKLLKGEASTELMFKTTGNSASGHITVLLSETID
ncbi:MAG: hypothetical protein AAB477_02955 [Patescibacteria group bacterium]